jgi:hypothetical protein
MCLQVKVLEVKIGLKMPAGAVDQLWQSAECSVLPHTIAEVGKYDFFGKVSRSGYPSVFAVTSFKRERA